MTTNHQTDVARALMSARSAIEIITITQSLFQPGQSKSTIMAVLKAIREVGHHLYTGKEVNGEMYTSELLLSALQMVLDPSQTPEKGGQIAMIAFNVSLSQLSESELREVLDELLEMVQDDNVAMVSVVGMLNFIFQRKENLFQHARPTLEGYIHKLLGSETVQATVAQMADRFERVFVLMAAGLFSSSVSTKDCAMKVKNLRTASNSQLKELRGTNPFAEEYEKFTQKRKWWQF